MKTRIIQRVSLLGVASIWFGATVALAISWFTPSGFMSGNGVDPLLAGGTALYQLVYSSDNIANPPDINGAATADDFVLDQRVADSATCGLYGQHFSAVYGVYLGPLMPGFVYLRVFDTGTSIGTVPPGTAYAQGPMLQLQDLYFPNFQDLNEGPFAAGTSMDGLGHYTLDMVLAGDPPPAIAITNQNESVANAVSNRVIGGTSANLVGQIRLTNSLNGHAATISAASPWSYTMPLAVGTNLITATGTNLAGQFSSDSVTIVRSNAAVMGMVTISWMSSYGFAQVDGITPLLSPPPKSTHALLINAGPNGVIDPVDVCNPNWWLSGDDSVIDYVLLSYPGNAADEYGAGMYGNFSGMVAAPFAFYGRIVQDDTPSGGEFYFNGYVMGAALDGPPTQYDLNKQWDDALDMQMAPCGSAPAIEITNANETVANEISSRTIGGTSANLVGTMTWANSLGGSGSFAASANWSVPNISLSVGTNIITVTGTNSAGNSTADSVAIIRSSPPAATPYLDITNANQSVANSVSNLTIAGVSSNLVGQIRWTNSLNGMSGSIAAASSWSFSSLLAVGTNVITASGTNGAGTSAADSVVIIRSVPPAATPYLDITNANQSVANSVSNLTIGGVSSNLVGQIRWTNQLHGAAGSFAAAASWSFTTPLAVGTNLIIATGTNLAGQVSSDSVTIVRSNAAPSGVIAINWFNYYGFTKSDGLTPLLWGAPSATFLQLIDAGPNGMIDDVDVCNPNGWVSGDDEVIDTLWYQNYDDNDFFTPYAAGDYGLVIANASAPVTFYGRIIEDDNPVPGDMYFNGPLMVAPVQTMQDPPISYDLNPDAFEPTPLFVVMLPCGSSVSVDITNNSETVDHAVSTITIGGTSSGAEGTMTWVNNLGGSGSFAAAANWSVQNISLAVGANLITVTGTNSSGNSAADSVMITREAAASNPGIGLEKTVGESATFSSSGEMVIGTNGQWVTYFFVVENVGDVTLTNVVVNDPAIPFNSNLGTMVAGQSMTASVTDAISGSLTNLATATGWSPDGGSVSDSDTALVEVQATGPIPLLDITNVNQSVGFAVSNLVVGGVSSNLIGSIVWTNQLNGAAGSFPVASSWSFSSPLAVGTNVISASGRGGSFTVTTQAMDRGADSVYSNGWATGDNGGSGFGPWQLTTTIADPNRNGHFTATDPFYTSIGVPAWGLYANLNNTASAYRPLLVPLATNQVLSVQFENGLVDAAGSCGIELLNSATQSLFTFSISGSDAFYRRGTNLTDVGITTDGIGLEIRLAGPTNYSLTVSPQGGSTRVYQGALTPQANSQIALFRVWNYTAGETSIRDVFVNNLKITTETIEAGSPVSDSVIVVREPAPQSLVDALDEPALSWSSSGAVPWFHQTTTTRDGVDAAQSGAIGHSQSSTLETSVTGPGTLSFWWSVSSESGYDFLSLYIDGSLQPGRISGSVGWSFVQHALAPGVHTMRWVYSKDGSTISGLDAGWVDNVSWQPQNTYLYITNVNQTVANSVSNLTIGGVASNLAGQIRWTNQLNGANGTLASVSSWSFVGSMAVGTNKILVTGSNATGQVVTDVIYILRVSASSGDNLIINGDAELDPAGVDFSPWTITAGSPLIWAYGVPPTDLTTNTPGPTDCGVYHFAGGSNAALSVMIQTVDVTHVETQISGGLVGFILSGWLGGWGSQNDAVTVYIYPLSSLSVRLATNSIGPVYASDRANQNGLIFKSVAGMLPIDTRSILVEVQFVRTSGTYNDGYADNLALVLTQGSTTPMLDITNANQAVANSVSNLTIGGVSSNLTGQIRWTNQLNGAAGSFAAAASWSFGSPLSVGTNVIVVSGTNGAGQAASDNVSIVRSNAAVSSYVNIYWFSVFGFYRPDGVTPLLFGAPKATYLQLINAGPNGMIDPVDVCNPNGWVSGDDTVMTNLYYLNFDDGDVEMMFAAGDYGVYSMPSTASVLFYGRVVEDDTPEVGDVYYDGYLMVAPAQAMMDPPVAYDLTPGVFDSVPLNIPMTPCGGAVSVNITNTAATVRYGVSNITVGGTSAGASGFFVWTNLANGFAGTYPVSSPFNLGPVPLAIGTNIIVVKATNATGGVDSDSVVIARGGLGTDLPVIDATNANQTVAYAVSNLVVGGMANAHVVGQITWQNSLGGSGSIAAAGAWSYVAPLTVGTNVINVRGSNWWSEVSTDVVTVVRSAATLPWLDITNAPATVGFAVSNQLVGGFSSNLVGQIRWTNQLNGAAGTLAAAANWSLVCPLGVGSNLIVVSGSNGTGQAASDSIGVTRVAAPTLDVTNVNATVRYSISNLTVGGSTGNGVTGQLRWTNALTGASGTVAAANPFSIPGIALNIGANTITVRGTNLYGDLASDSVTIERGAIGTDLPLVDVTNVNETVAHAVSSLFIGGTANAHVVGQMTWVNSLGWSGGFAAATNWSFNASLGVGTNVITVTGTNLWGEVSQDVVSIVRAAADDPLIITVDKDFVSASQPNGSGAFTINYMVYVQNVSTVDGVYDLVDTPVPDSNVMINFGLVSGQAGSMLFGSGPYMLASGMPISAGQTHTYILELHAQLSADLINGVTNAVMCGEGGFGFMPGEGLFNEAMLMYGPQSVTEIAVACGEVPTMPVMASLIITNANQTVANAVSSITIGGTSYGLVGAITWINNLTMESDYVLVAESWSIAGIPLAVGTNTISVFAQDAFSNGYVDDVTIIRLPSGGGGGDLGEAVDQPSLSWTSSGTAPWFSQTVVTHDGVDAAQSGDIGDSQFSTMETTVTGPGTLTFWWSVSSESGFDYLVFIANGVEQSGKISGTVGWTQKSYELTAGTHVLQWKYYKDGSVSSGSDAGWVDQVTWQPQSQALQVIGTNGAVIASGELASVAKGTDFGWATEGVPVSHTFILTNAGVDTITISQAAIVGIGADEFDVQGVPGQLAAGASATFTVTYLAATPGTFTAGLDIISDDPASPYMIALRGSVDGAPVWTTEPVTNVLEGETYTYAFNAVDPEGAPVSYSSDLLPSWLSIATVLVSGVDGESIITTVAGNGSSGFSGDLGPSTNASLNVPYSVTVSPAGELYISDSQNDRVRKVGHDGVIRTVAGNGTTTYNGDNIAATNAGLNLPIGITVDAAGNLYIADYEHHRVRKVGTNGIITTVAGTGAIGSSGDGGPATNATLYLPTDLDVDAAGNLYIAEYYGNRVRKVAVNGVITTVAGGGASSADGVLATNAFLPYPYGVEVDAVGRVYVSLYHAHIVRRIGTDGLIHTVAGTGTGGFAGDGGAAVAAQLNNPAEMAFDAQGRLYIADTSNLRIRRVATNGMIQTLAGSGIAGYNGDGGSATNAQLQYPYSVAVGPDGTVYIADSSNHRVRKLAAEIPQLVLTGTPGPGDVGTHPVTLHASDGTLSSPQSFTITVIGLNPPPYWTSVPVTKATVGKRYVYRLGAVDPEDEPITFGATGLPSWLQLTRGSGEVLGTNIITTVAGTGAPVFSGEGVPATNAAMRWPHSVIIDPSGNIYISDHENHRVRKIDTDGIIRTVAGNGSVSYNGDGIAATNASLYYPVGLELDAQGRLYIADHFHNRVRRIETNGIITTIAGTGAAGFSGDGGAATNATMNGVIDISLDGNGNLYIADPLNSRIRKVDANGIITTVAGNGGWGYGGDGLPATNATLNRPIGVTADRQGVLYISDHWGHRVRSVGLDGIMRTVAGNGAAGYNGDGIAATNASLYYPYDVTLDAAGNLYIADDENNRVRKVSTNGIISTVVGRGVYAYGGDGGAATNARIAYPTDVEFDSLGNLYVVDAGNHRLRKITGESSGWMLTGTPDVGDLGPVSITLTVTDGIYVVPQNFVIQVGQLLTPADLSANGISVSAIALAWTDNNADETAYVLERRASSNAVWTILATLPAGSTSYTDTGLASGQAYSYRISASNQDGFSAPSAPVSATTLSIPGAPWQLTAVAAATNRIQLAWTDTASNESGFELQRKSGLVGSWSVVASLSANTQAYADTGLAANTLYIYRLRATNAAGASAFSGEASASTPPVPADPDCGYVLRVTATNLTVDGSMLALPAIVSDQALMGGTLGVQQSSPRGVGSVQRVVMGFRTTSGQSVGTPREVSLLYGVPGCPGLDLPAVPVPSDLRAPSEAGTYRLWVEAYVTPLNPVISFRSQTRTNTSAMACMLGTCTVQPRPEGVVEVRALGVQGMLGQPVSVPVLLSSTGGVNTVAFSLTYDPAILTRPRVQAGVDAAAAWAMANTSVVGRVGVLVMMPGDESLESGTKNLVQVVFDPLAAGVSAVTFADTPTARSVAFVDPEVVLSASWVGDQVTIMQPGYEGDLAPRPGGDLLVTDADVVLMQLIVAGMEPVANSNEYRKADCSPRGTSGNGRIDVADLRQVMRYRNGEDPLAAAAGPSTPTNGILARSSVRSVEPPMVVPYGESDRVLYLPDTSAARGETFWLPVMLAAQGNESTLGFSVVFDPDRLAYLDVRTVGAATNAILVPSLENLAAGRAGFALAMPGSSVWPAGNGAVLEIGFSAAAGAGTVTTTVMFADNPVPRGCADINAVALSSSYTGAVVTLTAEDAPGAPDAPLDIAASAVSTSQVNLTWTDFSFDETGFRVWRRQGAEPWTVVMTMPPDAESYADGGLAARTEYRYMVEAYNGDGSGFSAETQARTWDRVTMWRLATFGTTANQGDAADAGDWDYDGVPNLVEYTLGTSATNEYTDPDVWTMQVRNGVTIGTNRFLTATYELTPDAAPDMAVIMQVNTNLLRSWSIPMVPVDENVVNGNRRVRVRSSQPLGVMPAEFIRMQVEPEND